MHIDLTHKTALVSGSSGGIGFAIAAGLAEAGATVVLNGPTEELVERALRRLHERVPKAIIRGVAADLGSAQGVARLVAASPRADILVNNLGIYAAQDFFEIPDEEWQRFYDVNIMSGVRLSRAYLPGMAQRGWGRLIFLSSESGLNVPPDMLHYGVTKTAMLGLSRGLAKRMAGTAVTVNAVLPGPTLSDGLVALLREEQEGSGRTLNEVAAEFVKAHRPSSIIRRPASVEEVASLVVYLASPQASATTGAAMRVDGGVVDTIA